jgi:hypothetical protein
MLQQGLAISAKRLRIAALAANCSRICMKARTTKTLIATASGLFSTVAAMMAPCSVKAWGKYLIFCPRFKIAICDLERRTDSASSAHSEVLEMMRLTVDVIRGPPERSNERRALMTLCVCSAVRCGPMGSCPGFASRRWPWARKIRMRWRAVRYCARPGCLRGSSVVWPCAPDKRGWNDGRPDNPANLR